MENESPLPSDLSRGRFKIQQQHPHWRGSNKDPGSSMQAGQLEQRGSTDDGLHNHKHRGNVAAGTGAT